MFGLGDLTGPSQPMILWLSVQGVHHEIIIKTQNLRWFFLKIHSKLLNILWTFLLEKNESNFFPLQ